MQEDLSATDHTEADCDTVRLPVATDPRAEQKIRAMQQTAHWKMLSPEEQQKAMQTAYSAFSTAPIKRSAPTAPRTPVTLADADRLSAAKKKKYNWDRLPDDAARLRVLLALDAAGELS